MSRGTLHFATVLPLALFLGLDLSIGYVLNRQKKVFYGASNLKTDDFTDLFKVRIG